MCTVTYLPKNRNGYFLTSSRDEKITRASLFPAEYLIGEKHIFFPKDPISQGTWIAQSQDKLICLLNGAFLKHTINPPYKRSRGLVALDYFNFHSIETFRNYYSFILIEPFTLIVLEDQELYEFRWDGFDTYLKPLDKSKPYIWSSCTLYNPDIIKKREQWFLKWLSENPNYNADQILELHKNGGDGSPEIDFKMQRDNGLQTISITSVEKKETYFSFKHLDLISENFFQENRELTQPI